MVTAPDPVPAGPSLIELSPNQSLGRLAWVHPEALTVLVELDPQVPPPPTGGRVIARDFETFAPHAVLEWLNEPRGRYYPARLLAGHPQVGDEIVTPGAELRQWGEQILAELPARASNLEE